MLRFDKKMIFSRFFWFLFYVLVLGMLLWNSYRYLDPDFGWHLQVGQEISQSGTVPTLNHYNYTYTGSWVDHEWWGDWYLYKFYEFGGYGLLSWVFAVLALISLILIFVRARLQVPEGAFLFLAALQIVALTAALPSLGIRLQELGWFFLILLFLIIEIYQRRRSVWLLAILPALIYLWSCLHGSFLLGLAILLAWPMIKIGERLIKKFFSPANVDFSELLTWREIFSILSVWGLALLATFFGPYRVGLYSFLSSYQDNFYKHHIQEWLSQFILPLNYWQLFFMALVAFALFLYLYHSLSREKYFKINIWQLFIVLLFFYLAWESRRHFSLLVAASLPWMFFVYTKSFCRSLNKNFYMPGGVWLKTVLILVMVLLITHYFININFSKQPLTDFCADYPCGAVDFLINHPEHDQRFLFNHYDWGGYLILALPGRELFIDGRLPQVGFAGHTFLAEYYDFFKQETDIGAKLAQYDVGLVLLPTHDKVLKIRNWERWFFGIKDENLQAPNFLREYLEGSILWELVYTDDTASIYAHF